MGSRGKLEKFLIPESIFGVGSLAEVGDAARRAGGSRALVVSDPGVLAAGWVDQAVPHLRAAGLSYRIWSDLTPNPKDREVEAGFLHYLDSGCDVLVAIGGGSPIDAAKAIAVLSGNGGSILDYEGIDTVGKPIPPMVMVPSTGGSGADVSQFCVITDTRRRLKCTIAGRALVPDISVTDPRLLTTMSPELSAHTALDALSHGIEAYVSKAASFLSDVHALAAIRGVLEHLLPTMDDPADLRAREGIARASLQAGIAFTNALLGATHAIAHQIGGYLEVPHGLLNAILLPHVMRFNAATHPERFVGVAGAMGVETARLTPQECAEAAIATVQALREKVGIPAGLAKVGVRREHLGRFAENALNDAYITTNPRTVSKEDVEQICLAAL
ncbi:MAG: iron-containing alcohol dehydrogenase [Actinophytocola sp.]|uniref:iron-containing alcohol dehydrogenase n=1 Tax=Actinophytocola sp. TaxID=1872138 RepID=UPI001325CA3D|nr:iron-containing alcohol dehydrogenase [Actinophytocola sp.]MPZ85534.1 iron-containing alcohol dehydrogenase [Actinophytocola sp.]